MCCSAITNDRDDSSSNAGNKNGNNNSDNGPPDVSRHQNLGLLPTQCGSIENDRIFGGNKTRLYEMPWMVLIAYDSGKRSYRL